MKNSSGIIMDSPESTAILSVSPMQGDHNALAGILSENRRADGIQPLKWKLIAAWTLERASKVLRRNPIPVAICESDLEPGGWRELLQETNLMPHHPLVIVTSRLADERLWSEALNLGAWDVLAKPFDRLEVHRVVEAAWRRWKEHESSGSARHRARISASP